MHRVTTDAVALHDRFSYWRDLVTQQFVHLRPERVSDAPFHGEIATRTLDEVSLSCVASGGQRVFRGHGEIARSPVPLYFVNVQIEGASSFRQGGEETALVPGDVFVVDAQRAFELGCEAAFRQLSIKLPKSLVDPLLATPSRAAGAFLPRDAMFARLIAAYAREAFGAPDGAEPASIALVAGHLAELAGHALRQASRTSCRTPATFHDALFAQAQGIIRRRFASPALTPGAIAREMRISTRLLHRLFAERNARAMHAVWEKRLARAAELLADPAARGRSITDIAFACGFADASHFARVFNRAHGETPARWRSRALELKVQ